MNEFVEFGSDAEIEAIAIGLMERTLPKPAWTHAAHFASAVWFLRAYGSDALARLRPAIRAYNEATGVPNTDSRGYHETITRASLLAAEDFLRTRPEGEAMYCACNALLATRLGKSDWLLTMWSRERLFSVEARREWVAPDLQALRFG